MVKIVQNGDPVLRAEAKEVPVKDIKTPKIQKIIDDMKLSLASQKDGVAIAAPQIGIPLRIFVVSAGTLRMADKEKFGDLKEDLVFINPEIIKLSRNKDIVDEGCLSVRYLYGKMKRAKKAVVKAYDENAKLFERGGSGLLAQVFQHETDHLNGILFIDKAYDIEEITPEELEKMQNSQKEE